MIKILESLPSNHIEAKINVNEKGEFQIEMDLSEEKMAKGFIPIWKKAKEMKELGYKYFPMGYMTDNWNYKGNKGNDNVTKKVKLSDYE